MVKNPGTSSQSVISCESDVSIDSPKSMVNNNPEE